MFKDLEYVKLSHILRAFLSLALCVLIVKCRVFKLASHKIKLLNTLGSLGAVTRAMPFQQSELLFFLSDGSRMLIGGKHCKQKYPMAI